MCKYLTSGFNPEVWGTVSDWVVAFSTLLSVILLIWTLRSQIKVQTMQLKSLDIDNARFLQEQNLTIPIEIKSCEIYKLGDESIRVAFKLILQILNANFKKLTLSFDKEVAPKENIPNQYDFLYNGDVVQYEFSIDLPYEDYINKSNQITLTMNVLDYANNELSKETIFTYQNGGYGILDRDNGFKKTS